MPSSIFVTGGTGNVGREVVRQLRARQIHVRVGDRDPQRARARFEPEVDIVPFDFSEPRTFAAADGVDGVFLLRPPAIADMKHTLLPFLDRARQSGAPHIVFLSVAGAADNKLVPHHAVEQYLNKTTGWTILRPGFFAQNFRDAYRRDIVEDGRIYVPAGRGRVAFVDVRDVAEVAAAVLALPRDHERRVYTLTGPVAVDFTTAARILSDAIGREIRYEAASIVGYMRHLRRRELSWTQAAVQTVLHAGLRFGQAAQVDPTLERLLGRPGTSLDQYLRDDRETWS